MEEDGFMVLLPEVSQLVIITQLIPRKDGGPKNSSHHELTVTKELTKDLKTIWMMKTKVLLALLLKCSGLVMSMVTNLSQSNKRNPCMLQEISFQVT